MLAPNPVSASTDVAKLRVGNEVSERAVVVSTTPDPQRRNVVLTLGRWRHIVSRHPEMRGFQHDVTRAIHIPTIQRTVSSDEAWFYLADAGPSAWLKVVVVYSGGIGRIITAFPRRTMP